MKEILGSFVPQGEWNVKKNTLIILKMQELNYLLKSSLMSENMNPNMLKCDQDRRLIPLMIPTLKVLTELVGGPCRPNMLIIHKFYAKFHFYTIMTRMINDLLHPFYELKKWIVNFLLGMCESEHESFTKSLARNLATSS
jgi:hypothetical protein